MPLLNEEVILMKYKKLTYLILPVITLILEILPCGAVMKYAHISPDFSIGYYKTTHSYFDLIPFGNANFAPLLTAIVTCLIIVILVIFCFTDNTVVLKTIKATLIIGTVLSLCPLLPGIEFFSVTGAFITVTLLAESILIFLTTKQ